jgi:chaperonin GroES
MARIKPAPNYILVEPIEEENVSAGGVYTPEKSTDKPSKGLVVDVGSYMETENVNLVLYDVIRDAKVIIYKKWTNQEVQHEGKTYLLIHFNELLGVIE